MKTKQLGSILVHRVAEFEAMPIEAAGYFTPARLRYWRAGGLGSTSALLRAMPIRSSSACTAL
jgi:hypothetical protein